MQERRNAHLELAGHTLGGRSTLLGKPCVKGTRITVYDVLEYLAGGMSEDQILNDFRISSARTLPASPFVFGKLRFESVTIIPFPSFLECGSEQHPDS